VTNGDVEKQMYTVVCSCIVPFCACWTHLCLDRKMLCVKCTLLWQKKELYVPTEKNSVCVVHSSAPTEEEEEEEEEEKKKEKEKEKKKKKKKKKTTTLCRLHEYAPTEKCSVYSCTFLCPNRKKEEKKGKGGCTLHKRTTILSEKQTNSLFHSIQI